jgi:hypothetical protein
MHTTGKFVLGCAGFGIVSFLCLALLGIAPWGHSSLAQGSSSPAGNAVQTALDQAGSLCRQTFDNAAPELRSFADASDAFISSNATTARLQFEGMKNTVATHLALDAWVPGDAPNSVRAGHQVAAEATGIQAIAVATRIPTVRSLKSNLERVTGVR